jgi:hypothetical protein
MAHLYFVRQFAAVTITTLCHSVTISGQEPPGVDVIYLFPFITDDEEIARWFALGNPFQSGLGI